MKKKTQPRKNYIEYNENKIKSQPNNNKKKTTMFQ